MTTPDAIARAAATAEKFPDNELARFSYAKALFDAGRHAEAVEQFRRCIAKKPEWMVPTILLGRSLMAVGQKEEAREVLESALRLAVAQHHQGPQGEVEALLASLG